MRRRRPRGRWLRQSEHDLAESEARRSAFSEFHYRDSGGSRRLPDLASEVLENFWWLVISASFAVRNRLPAFLLSWEISEYLDLIKGVIVIVAYRPKSGKEKELLELVRNRVPTLKKENLVTDRVPTIMRARDGTIVEVSEWKSREAIEAAHKNPNVLALWNKFFAICDCIPLNALAEASELFAGFEPIEE